MKIKNQYILIFLFLIFIINNGCSRRSSGKPYTETVTPTVLYVSPADGTSGIPINTNLSATFSQDMDPSSINANSFNLKDSSNNVIDGDVTYGYKIAIFNPVNDLAKDTTYTAIITTSVIDLNSTALATNYSWSFTTGSSSDAIPPDDDPASPDTDESLEIESTNPLDGATNVSYNSFITATFNNTINSSTITKTSFLLKKDSDNTEVSGTPTATGKIATFYPDTNFEYNTKYVVTITTSVKDLEGNGLVSDNSWSFTTGTTSDTTPLTISTKVPEDNATSVTINQSITVTFNKTINSTTVTNSSFTLKNKTNNSFSTGTFATAGNAVTFDPSVNLEYGTSYLVTITTSVKDTAGISLASNQSWSFTTASETDNTRPTISSIFPTENSQNVSTETEINVYFSEEMDTTTIIKNSTYTVKQNGTNVDGQVLFTTSSRNNVRFTIATFVPNTALLPDTNYDITVTAGVKDKANNALASEKKWTFTTISTTTGNCTNLTAPEDLKIKSGDGTLNITLDWDGVETADYYWIRIDSPTTIFEQSTLNTEFSIPSDGINLNYKQAYEIYVGASRAGCSTVWSDDYLFYYVEPSEDPGEDDDSHEGGYGDRNLDEHPR